ncbi:DUF4126 domain-containing protein [Sphingomonas lenta]|uniref:DUF4126 domain-containing protein n=1 Tax=Sphingomonas lenta TaxID=1141887 RepID=A0A2A2SJI2_9SPHN|nr:DUF4126 domain-containing protein [Sphingomonas lenta]PAX09389.1 DUF4126 domain-containing protein [Sphingomonas lenta]
MLRSILIGLVAGQRSMTPLAILAGAARRGTLPPDAFGAKLLASPHGAAGAVALAAGEIAGDKMRDAPDRITLPGLLGRALTGGFAGAVLAARDRRLTGALLGAAAAVGSSFLGFHARVAAMRRFGQTSTGFAEDALMLGAASAVVNARA